MEIQAKSAGAQIRRHNEKQLMEKITNQITEWGPEYLSKCKTIFVRAPKHQKHVMLQPLHQIVSDKLVIRPCPCPMHKPRFKEVFYINSYPFLQKSFLGYSNVSKNIFCKGFEAH